MFLENGDGVGYTVDAGVLIASGLAVWPQRSESVVSGSLEREDIPADHHGPPLPPHNSKPFLL